MADGIVFHTGALLLHSERFFSQWRETLAVSCTTLEGLKARKNRFNWTVLPGVF